METWLRVQAPDGSLHDVALRLAPESAGADVALALARQVGLPDPGLGSGWCLYSHRLEAWLASTDAATALDMRQGDTVALATAGTGAPREPAAAPGGGGPIVPFNRQPRVLRPAVVVARSMAAPPAEPGKPRLPLITAALPLLLGAVMLLFTRSLVTLAFVLLSPLLAMGSYAEGRLGGRGDFRRGSADFHGRLEELEGTLRATSAEETRRREDEAPGLRRLALAAHRRDPWLWQRRPQDPDFLALRAGVGEQPARARWEIADGGSPRLRAEAAERLQRFSVVRGVPIVVPLAECAPLGLAGPRAPMLDVARWLVLQAACLHSPRNLAICAALPTSERDAWDWLKWLPHRSTSNHQIDGPLLCCEESTARDLVERLVDLLDRRSADVGLFRGAAARAPYPYVLAILHEDIALPRASLTRLLAEGPRAGIVALWLGRAVRDLPNECRAVVEVEAEGTIALTYPEDGRVERGGGEADGATEDQARQVALELSPLRDASAGDADSQPPRQVGLVEVLGLPSPPRGLAIASRWETGSGLRVPIGATALGTFEVDLRADGPHALVGGTTGAGKSELLRSLVVGLAASHPPRRLNFLLVDYKGGSAFQDAVRLPHTVGLVTDLDEHLARRALVSLRAELRRREEVLRAFGARDLVELERSAPAECPPSLAIVVDEFATLAREVPEFVDGVVDLAQRGRSLGLHLVLATQRPAGVVSDNIRANTNLRIALRMSDDADSTDVVGVPDAARLQRSQPGRAFARTGHQELTEFQAAYSGDGVASTAAGTELVVAALGLAGPAWPAAPQAPATSAGGVLDAVVAAISEAHAAAGGGDPSRPWLPQLPGLVAPPPAPGPATPLAMSLGLVDLPHRQRQEPWLVDLATDAGLLVLGTAGSGKTSLLRLVATSLAAANPPTKLHLYVVDCAGGGLAALQALPHCGAYIRADETERLARLVQWLRELVDSRRARAATAMSGARGAGDEAAVVVLVDSYGALVSAIARIDLGEHVDTVTRLVADGPGAGVNFVLSADRRAEVPAALSNALPTRVVLRMADEDEYRNAGVPAGACRGLVLPPGRGFLDGGVEVQCAVLGHDGTAESQVLALRKIAAAARVPGKEVEIPGVRLLPVRVELSELPPSSRSLSAVVGLADVGFGPAELDLDDDGAIVIGPPHSGRSTALAVAAGSLGAAPLPPRLLLLAPRRSPLTAMTAWGEVAMGPVQCARLAQELATTLGQGAADGRATVLVIDDGEELAEGAAAGALEIVARRGRDAGFRLLAAVETRSAHRAYSGWVAELRKGRQGILLQPDVDLDGDLLGCRLPRRGHRPFPPGRAYLVHRGRAALVQVAVAGGSAHQGDGAVATGQQPHQGMTLEVSGGA